MKVALEAGEVLDIALLEGDSVIGTISLELKGLVSRPRVGRPAGSTSSDKSASDASGVGRRKKRKPMSAESRARMAEAQRRRWGKTNSSDESGNDAGSNQ